jgi:hypothetical protein
MAMTRLIWVVTPRVMTLAGFFAVKAVSCTKTRVGLSFEASCKPDGYKIFQPGAFNERLFSYFKKEYI